MLFHWVLWFLQLGQRGFESCTLHFQVQVAAETFQAFLWQGGKSVSFQIQHSCHFKKKNFPLNLSETCPCVHVMKNVCKIGQFLQPFFISKVLSKSWLFSCKYSGNSPFNSNILQRTLPLTSQWMSVWCGRFMCCLSRFFFWVFFFLFKHFCINGSLTQVTSFVTLFKTSLYLQVFDISISVKKAVCYNVNIRISFLIMQNDLWRQPLMGHQKYR